MKLVAREESATDAELWRALRLNADRTAFADLFNRYADVVYNVCFRRLASWSAAEEATQATFTALWQSTVDGRLGRLEGDSALGIILWRARKVMADAGRSDARSLRVVRAVGAERVDAHEPVDEWVEAEAVQQRIVASMASLPANQREVIELVCWADASLADTAAALGVPLGTVKSRLARARETLRSHPAMSSLLGEVS